jgi:hypothetical protein
MSERILIPLAKLQIDTQNPRLSKPSLSQREAQREIAQYQQSRVVKLAEDIVLHNLNPAELPMVLGSKDRYIVLDGNRRLVALRGLESPKWMEGALHANLFAEMRRLSKQYLDHPIESILCLIFKDREEARHWIEIRHGGQMEGAGVVRWGADERARFLARNRPSEIHTQILNFLQERGYLTSDQRKAVPTASFKRLMGTAEVRHKVGIRLEKGEMKLVGEEKKVVKALLYIVNDLASGKTKTKAIYEKEDRIAYANNLPANIAVEPATKSGEHDGSKKQPRKAKYKSTPPRDILIPPDCILHIAEPRIDNIATELRGLSLQHQANAVSVLFRVFVELSCDAYITAAALSTDVLTAKLSTKLQDVTSDLVARTRLSEQEARPVRIAAQKNTYLAASISVMNEYIHSPYIFPEPGDLRAGWSSLQPCFVALWSVHASLKKPLANKARKL